MGFQTRFLIDECLSPKLVDGVSAPGIEITHVNFRGLRQRGDPFIVKWCVDNDFALITNNARDFRTIYRRLELHPGLVILLPSIDRHRHIPLLQIVIDHVATLPDIVNKLIEIDLDGVVTVLDWPVPEA
jgi:predicted nuclease of predicted toxin-antitoxin system